LTIIIPSSLFSDFRDFLQSTISISRYVQTQSRVKAAIQKVRDLPYQEEQIKRFKNLEAKILSTFDSYISSGQSPREAIRSTRDRLNNGERYYTCCMIEMIVRSGGRLSKRQRKEGNREKPTPKTKRMVE
jgi:hypothetical protein